jgi:hypothetical protein
MNQVITTPGIYAIPHDDYHKDCVIEPSLSASIANILLTRSPAHARQAHPRLNPDYAPEEDSRFDLGSAAHALLLERDGSRIAWVEADDWRSANARAARIDARAGGLLPVLARYQPVMREMVRVAHETIERSEFAGIFTRGKPERTLAWQDDGIWCRSRVDWLTDDHATILEYKSTANASFGFFSRQIGNMGYDLQAEFYRRGLAALGLNDNPVQIILAQEIEPPYACALYTLSNAFIEVAQHKVERAVQTWRMCMQSGLWPAYGTGIAVIDPPAWEANAHLQRLEMEANT